MTAEPPERRSGPQSRSHACLLLRYKDNPFTVGDAFGSRWDSEGGTASFAASWALEKEEPKEEVTISSVQPVGERYLSRDPARCSPDRSVLMSALCSRLPSRRKAEASAPGSESSKARQKFANAKAISSDMFFGRESSAEVRSCREVRSGPVRPGCLCCSLTLCSLQYEAKTRLESLSGSTSISSADLFGEDGEQKGELF